MAHQSTVPDLCGIKFLLTRLSVHRPRVFYVSGLGQLSAKPVMRASALACCELPNVAQLAYSQSLCVDARGKRFLLIQHRIPSHVHVRPHSKIVCCCRPVRRCTGPGGLCGSRRRSLLLPSDCCAGLTCTNSAIKNEEDCAQPSFTDRGR